MCYIQKDDDADIGTTKFALSFTAAGRGSFVVFAFVTFVHATQNSCEVWEQELL